MVVIGRQERRVAPSGPSFAYIVAGIALGCIWLSYVLGAVFGPDMVTGAQHEHFNSAAAIGWIFNGLATGMVVTAALQGIRARVTDKAPWAVLGLGTGAIWLAIMFVTIFAPDWVTGTDPERIPGWAGLGAIAGVILTWILCRFVKTASFEPVEPSAALTTTSPTDSSEAPAEDATVTLRRLAQLRDSGVITEADFQGKKSELLSRI
ncbi:MAG TPA: SHOCT domain-containing protein [Acidimicrobiales bacterium]|nr:SHOCT domain-containing protein [Acidimicrobiales bacterium]